MNVSGECIYTVCINPADLFMAFVITFDEETGQLIRIME